MTLLLVGSSLAGALPARAQTAATDDGLEEIVVTASRTGATALQDTPLAISAFSAAQLERSGASDLVDLVPLQPSLNIVNNASALQVNIRGVGTNLIFAGNDPSTAVHVDGVYRARTFGLLTDFLDVERIEVVRGPQGTLYGRNAVGGTINIISRRPSRELDYRVAAEYGTADARSLDAYLAGPLAGDRVAASAAVKYSKSDGLIENRVPGGTDLRALDRLSARGQILVTPSEALEVTLRGDWTRVEDSQGAFPKLLEPLPRPGVLFPVTPLLANAAIPRADRIANDGPLAEDTKTWGLALEADLEVSDAVSLKSLTAYRETDVSLRFDSDATELPLNVLDFRSPADQLSQELNLNLELPRLKALLGAYVFREDVSEDFVLRFPLLDPLVAPFGVTATNVIQPAVETRSWALFGQGTYEVTATLSATLGLRYTRDRKSIDFNGVEIIGAPPPGPRAYAGRRRDDAFTPKVGLDWRPDEDLLVYATASRGYKSGGFQSEAFALDSYGPERLWAYEVGLKADTPDRTARLNLAAFYYDYANFQVLSFTNFQVDVENVPEVRIRGVEAEAFVRPGAGFEAGASLAYVDAEYRDFADAVDVATGATFDARGRRLSGTPKWKAATFAQASRDIGAGRAYVRGELSFQDRVFFAVNNERRLSQESYALVNASVGFETADERLGVSLFARNLFDTGYLTAAARFAGIGQQAQGYPGDPRTVGVRLTLRR